MDIYELKLSIFYLVLGDYFYIIKKPAFFQSKHADIVKYIN